MSNGAFELALAAAIDGKTKPVGALGRLEALAAQIARLQGTLRPRMERCRLTIFAADHGLAAEGVSAYPQAVTRQMVLTFLAGGAAASVIAAQLGVEVAVVDAGVAGEPIEHPALIRRWLGSGTANALHGPAMTADQLAGALDAGTELGRDSRGEAAAFGEMGIGNTSAAALLAAKLTGIAPAVLVGAGTGLAGEALARKAAVLARAAARTGPRLPPEVALAEYGGFEIAMMTGAMLGAAEAGKLVLVDGFIATAAAAAALGLRPELAPALVFAHRSAEAGHGPLLEALGAEPLLDLGMRLGEGTGALLSWPVVQAAAAFLRDMASFESAGVSRA